LSLSWAISLQSTPPHSISLRFILILSMLTEAKIDEIWFKSLLPISHKLRQILYS
jgi:hypothetical protein